jgi:hypothetical protein
MLGMLQPLHPATGGRDAGAFVLAEAWLGRVEKRWLVGSEVGWADRGSGSLPALSAAVAL